MLKTSKTVEHNSLTKTNKYENRQKRIFDSFERFDGKIRIFRTTHSGDVYQMSMYIKDEKRYVRKSLKTRDKKLQSELQKMNLSTIVQNCKWEKKYSH